MGMVFLIGMIKIPKLIVARGSDGVLVLVTFAPEQGTKMSHIFCKHQAPKKQQPGIISVAHKLTLHISRFLS